MGLNHLCHQENLAGHNHFLCRLLPGVAFSRGPNSSKNGSFVPSVTCGSTGNRSTVLTANKMPTGLLHRSTPAVCSSARFRNRRLYLRKHAVESCDTFPVIIPRCLTHFSWGSGRFRTSSHTRAASAPISRIPPKMCALKSWSTNLIANDVLVLLCPVLGLWSKPYDRVSIICI